MKQGKMQQPRHQLKGIWLAFALAGISQIAWAADEVSANASNEKASSEKESATKDPVALKAVTVTAQRRVENAQKAAVAVSVVNTQTITADGVRAIGDITTFVPNAAAKNPDGDGRPRWYIRGLGTGDTGASTVYPVGIYADDVFLSAPIAGGGPLFDLERIEILRGPQGTLYGKNTTAGAVNIISKKPTFDTEAYATVGVGDKSERIVSGAVGGAILDERLAGRVSVYSEERDGFGKNTTTGNTYGDVNKKAIRLQLLAQLTPNLDALLKVHAREFKGDGSNGSLPLGTYNGYTRPRGRNIGINVDEDYKVQHQGTSLTFNWDLSGYKLTSITAYDYIRNESFTDADYTPYDSNGSTDSDNRYRQYSQEFRLASPQEDRLRWLVGTHYFKETLDSSAVRFKAPGQLADGSSNQTGTVYRDLNYAHDTESFAAFGNIKYDFTEKFTLGGGLRWTEEKKDIDLNLVQRINSGGVLVPLAGVNNNGSRSRDKTWDAWTWDLTPEYKINDNVLVFFRYAKGFRSGGFNTGLTGGLAELTTVDPEKLDSYEIGLKSNWLNNRLIANANVFYYDYKNIQANLLTVNQGVTTTALTNGAKGEVRGAELELEAQATERLHLRAALSYLDTEYTDFKNIDPVSGVVANDYSGNRFVRSPRQVVALGGDYTFPLFNGSKLIAAGDFSYRGKEYFLVNRQSEDALDQESYTIGNARLTWVNSTDKVSLTAFVNNFTDRKYQVHGRPNGSQALGQYVITYGNPRFAGLNLTVRF